MWGAIASYAIKMKSTPPRLPAVGYQLSFVKQPITLGALNEACRKSSWVIFLQSIARDCGLRLRGCFKC